MKKNNVEYKEIIRPAILARDNNTCRACGVRNKARVYNDSRGNYVDCDEFIEQWARANGKKVYSVGLDIVKEDPYIDDYTPSNLITLCPKCSKRYNRLQKRLQRDKFDAQIKRSKTYSIKGTDLVLRSELVELRYRIEQMTAIRLNSMQLEMIAEIVNKNK